MDKGQEEMVGFAVVVIVVAVIGVILLGILVRSPESTAGNSGEVHSFLESVLQASSLCKIEQRQVTIGESIQHCYSQQGEKCEDGKSVCESVNETLESAIGASWQIGIDKVYSGYKLSVSSSSENSRKIISQAKGECKTRSIGSEQILSTKSKKESLIIELSLCYTG